MARARASSWLVAWSAVLLLGAGCASEFERRYAEAEQLRIEAADRGYEWIGTAGLLEEARSAADAGDNEAALELVAEARFQAEAALQQAEREREAWRRRVVK